MYKKSKKLIVWCLVVSMVLTQMLFTNAAFAATSAATRLAGADRYQTAIEVSKAGWTSSDNAVIAYGEDFPDALTAAPLAKKYNAPILLTGKTALSAGVLAELQRLGVKNVFVVGGEGVVSKAVADALVAAGMSVERLAGADRYATALAVANKIGTSSEVVVAYGENYPDALSISAIAAAKGMPILLTDKNAMSDAVKAYIGTKKAYVVGGEGVVSATVFNGLTGAVRLGGADRYATNVAVMSHFAANLNFGKVFVATGENFADALAGSAYAAKVGAPIVLAYTTLADGTKAFLNGKVAAEAQVIALGGVAVVSEAAVAAVKAPVVVPATLQVESVSALNRNQIKVVFTQEVDKDSANLSTSYQIDGADLSADDKAVLQSDNKTVIITLDDARDQFSKKLFTVKDKVVLSKDTLTTVPKNETEITFSDVTVPTVKTVKVTGNKKLTVEFAEAVMMPAGFISAVGSSLKIDGQYLTSFGFSGATAVDATADNKYSYKLELNFDVAIPSGSHTLTVPAGTSSQLVDAASFMVAKTDVSFTVEAVTTAPQVVSVTGENNGTIYVTYDRSMDSTTAQDEAKYTINGVAANAADFKSGTDSKVVKVVFNTANAVAKGSNVLVIDNLVKDTYGNKLHADTDIRFSFTATEDTTKPSVVSVSMIDSTHLRIKFSENVDYAFATTRSNYTLKDSNGVTITADHIAASGAIESISAGNHSDTYTITLNPALTGSNYTLKIKNLVDRAATPNTMDEYVATFSGRDDQAPTVSEEVMVDSSKIVVYFSEAMDAATITDRANLSYKDGGNTYRALPGSATVQAGEGNKSVVITFPTGYTVKTSGWNAVQYEVKGIRVANAKDVAGNMLSGIVGYSDVIAASGASTKPAYSANTFKLFADSSKVWAEFELNQTISILEVNDFVINGTTANTGYVSGKKVVLNFVDADKQTAIKALGAEAVLSTTGTIGSKNDAGIAVSTITATVYDDQIAPKLLTWTDSNDVSGEDLVTLTFSENVDATIAGLYSNDFTFVSGGKLLSVKEVTVSGASVIFHFADDSFGASAQVTVKAVADKIDIKDLKDAADNQNMYVPSSDDISGRVTAQ